MSGIKVLFLSPPGIHVRFFRALAAGLDERSQVEVVRGRILPARPGPEVISAGELDDALRIHRARRLRRNRLLMKSRIVRRIYDSVLRQSARWAFNAWTRRLAGEHWDAIAVWNGNRMPAAILVAAARSVGIPVLFFELGAMPGTLQVDTQGVNALNSLPRDPEFYLEQGDADFASRNLVPRPPRRGKSVEVVELPSRFLFAPFQVDADTQVVGFSPWIRDMRHWFEEMHSLQLQLRERGDPRVIVLREHPSDRENYSDLHEKAEAVGMIFANGNPMSELLEKAEGVLTLNSSVGIEALLHRQKIVVCGDAFYEVDGLVQSVRSREGLLAAVLALEEFQPEDYLRRCFLAYIDGYFLPNFNVQAVLAGDQGEARDKRDSVLARMSALLQGDN